LAYVLFVQFLSPPKPAGLDTPIFAGIPKIGCEIPIAKKKLKKKINGKFSEMFFADIFLQTFSMKTRSLA
jgi:hypothetical protein